MIDIYLLAGQSNMDGRAISSDLGDEFKLSITSVSVYINGGWRDLGPGLNYDNNVEWFGPEISFGRAIREVDGREIVLVKHAKGSTTLAEDWLAHRGVCYEQFVTAVKAAIASLESKDQVVIKGMIWMQGETDAWHQSADRANAYEKNLIDFIHSVRSEFDVPNLPIVIGRISPSWNWSGGGHGEIVRLAQFKVSQNLPNIAMIDTDDLELEEDEAHYNAGGQMLLGKRFADALIFKLHEHT